ncbi:Elongator subunit ELP4 [Sporobolomyces koalae]|uniref:Elongator subunit ELP4 n=1 Tax=Sporobolomyces koalae TaxID=500713 RepID=UPI00317FFD95
MSSFKKRSTVSAIPGTRPSSSSASPLVSVGLPTIDDLLGGGLPLSTSLLINQDYPTTYSELLLRYYIAQGLESNQETIVVASAVEHGGPDGIARVLMGTDKGTSATRKDDDKEDEEERKREEEIKDKMKIAFRYESMKQHQTTLNPTQPVKTGEAAETVYCSTFDLTTTRALSTEDRSRLHMFEIDEMQDSTGSSSEFYTALYERIESFVSQKGYLHTNAPSTSAPRRALRIAISSFGSPSWPGSSAPNHLYSFLHRIRSLLRRSNVSCLTTFPAYLYSTSFATRLSHASDSVLSLLSTSSSPSLSALYPSHQGLLTLPKLPSPSSLVPPSTKLSLLRNLGGGGQGRENLLGFRVKRKRFVVEVVSEEPGLGDEEAEKKARDRKKRVEEANRKDREEGGKATDVLLKNNPHHKGKAKATNDFAVQEAQLDNVVKSVKSVTIGPDQEEPQNSSDGVVTSTPTIPANAPKSAFKKKKGVRLGGVSFGDEPPVDEDLPQQKKKVSISAMLHKQPELLDF